ncbi:MAG TPA: hypothetical protein VK506_12245 [Conexibacter sp.]|nr:hypothetical protein [Conexibacter sp.]
MDALETMPAAELRRLLEAAYGDAAELESLGARVAEGTGQQLGTVLLGLFATLNVAASVLARRAVPVQDGEHVEVPEHSSRKVAGRARHAAMAGTRVWLTTHERPPEPADDDVEQLVAGRTGAAMHAYMSVSAPQVMLAMDSMSPGDVLAVLVATRVACKRVANLARALQPLARRYNAEAAHSLFSIGVVLDVVVGELIDAGI